MWNEVLALVTAVVVLGSAITTWRLQRTAGQTKEHIEQVHVLVNSRMAEMVRRVDQLTVALQLSDVDVPPPPPIDPSR